MANTSVAIQVLPSVAGEDLVKVVDKVIAYIESAGLPMYVGPFETSVEGEFDQVMEIVKQCQLVCVEAGAPSVISYIKLHYNPGGGVWSIEDKVAKYRE